MTVVSGTPTNGAIWQTRLSREAAATYEQDLDILGLDRSEALRRGLRLLHREALETRMAREVEEFYGGERAPLSDVTAAAYGRESTGTERPYDGSAAAP
jgi:hypothetical protein